MASKDKNSAQKPAASKKPSAAQEGKDAKAQRELGIVGPHGDMRLASVIIEGYSLELSDGEGYVGDVASRTAFRHMLDAWRKLYASMEGKDPMAPSPRANSANISWMRCWRKTAWQPKPSKPRRKTTRCSWRMWCSDF